MTSTLYCNWKIPSDLKIQNALNRIIQPYLETIWKLERALLSSEGIEKVFFFFKGGIVPYVLYPQQSLPVDCDLIIRVTPYSRELGKHIEAVWKRVFRSEKSRDFEKNTSELEPTSLWSYQCGHCRIPPPRNSDALPIDLTILGIKPYLEPDCTSTADAPEIFFEMRSKIDFITSLHLSPYAQKVYRSQLELILRLNQKNDFFVATEHAQATYKGLSSYAYKLTQGKRYVGNNKQEIELIYATQLSKAAPDKIDQILRHHIANHFCDTISKIPSLFFLLNVSDVIQRSDMHIAYRAKVIQVVSSIIIERYIDKVDSRALSKEELDSLSKDIIAFCNYYFFYESENMRQKQYLDSCEIIPYYGYVDEQFEKATLHIGRPRQRVANNQLWTEWSFHPIVRDSLLELTRRVPIEENKHDEQEEVEASLMPEVAETPIPPPNLPSLDPIANLRQFLQQFDRLSSEFPLYKLVSKLINLIKKSKRGEASDDLENRVFYFLMELQKTNKALHICELSEAFCRTGVLLSQKGLFQMVDLIVWFIERGDLPRAERLYKCIISKQGDVIETLCKRVVKPQMESKTSKLVVKWILNAFKEERVELLVYAKTSLEQLDPLLQTQFINSAYLKACVEGKKLLEEIAIEFMEHIPAEDRFDFYQKLETILFSLSTRSFFTLFHHMCVSSSNTIGFSACASQGLEHLHKQGIEGIEVPAMQLNEIFQTKTSAIYERWRALLGQEEGKGSEVESPQVPQAKKKKKKKPQYVTKVVKQSLPTKERMLIKAWCNKAEDLAQTGRNSDEVLWYRLKAYNLMQQYNMTGKIEFRQCYSLTLHIGKQYVIMKQHGEAFRFLKKAYELAETLDLDMEGEADRKQYCSLLFDISKLHIALQQNKEALPFLEKVLPLIEKNDMRKGQERQLYYVAVLLIQQCELQEQNEKVFYYLYTAYGLAEKYAEEKAELRQRYTLAFKIGVLHTDTEEYAKSLPFLTEAFNELSEPRVAISLIYALFKLNKQNEIVLIYSEYKAKGYSSVLLSWDIHCYIASAYLLEDKSRAFLHFAMAFNALSQAQKVDSEEQERVLEYMQSCKDPDCHSDPMVKSLVLQVMRSSSEIMALKRNDHQLPLILQQLESYLI